jgi:hypothetical protein
LVQLAQGGIHLGHFRLLFHRWLLLFRWGLIYLFLLLNQAHIFDNENAA